MEQNKAETKEIIQGDGNHSMRIERKFDAKRVDEIAKGSGSESVKGAASYLSIPFIGGGRGFICEIIDNNAFFAGTMCKKHFRLYEMAVRKESQKGGYGTAMLMRMKKLCRKSGVEKITCRTSKKETAINFYMKNGGRIVGEKGEDFEVEIPV